ncbi:MAG: hypothetical protein MZU79_05940 [Anaerotruncus sp.]|nr:hypothetical protein [Anaerotruncus sp.]
MASIVHSAKSGCFANGDKAESKAFNSESESIEGRSAADVDGLKGSQTIGSISDFGKQGVDVLFSKRFVADQFGKIAVGTDPATKRNVDIEVFDHAYHLIYVNIIRQKWQMDGFGSFF